MKALGAAVAAATKRTLVRPGGPPNALPSWIVDVPLPAPIRFLLGILWRWYATKGLVNPSISTLSRMMGCTPRTVQRYLAILEGNPSAHDTDIPRPARRYIARHYNGGRGRQCIYYLIPPGNCMNEAPLWPTEARFGGLKMGRFALRRHHPELLQNPDRRITLKRDHTSYDQRRERETKSAPAPLTPQAASPRSPPSGGTSSTQSQTSSTTDHHQTNPTRSH